MEDWKKEVLVMAWQKERRGETGNTPQVEVILGSVKCCSGICQDLKVDSGGNPGGEIIGTKDMGERKKNLLDRSKFGFKSSMSC